MSGSKIMEYVAKSNISLVNKMFKKKFKEDSKIEVMIEFIGKRIITKILPRIEAASREKAVQTITHYYKKKKDNPEKNLDPYDPHLTGEANFFSLWQGNMKLTYVDFDTPAGHDSISKAFAKKRVHFDIRIVKRPKKK